MGAPLASVTSKELRAFEEELMELRGSCDRVIVWGAQDRPELLGVDYVDTEAAALIAAAARAPSIGGLRSLLDDLLYGLSGNVIGPQASNGRRAA
jgi:hypothetical protein